MNLLRIYRYLLKDFENENYYEQFEDIKDRFICMDY